MLRAILNSKNMSLYELEKTSSISHATLNDIYNERSNINNCTISIMSKLADALFKSDTLQRLKKTDDSSFITDVIESKEIENYFFNKKYLESLYLLSLVDYLSNKNSIPLPKKYEQIRNYKCERIYVSKSIYLLLTLKQIKVTDIFKSAIKEFLKHNIVEAEIDKVA